MSQGVTQDFFFRRWTTKVVPPTVTGGSEQGRLSAEPGEPRYQIITPEATNDGYGVIDSTVQSSVSSLSAETASTFTII